RVAHATHDHESARSTSASRIAELEPVVGERDELRIRVAQLEQDLNQRDHAASARVTLLEERERDWRRERDALSAGGTEAQQAIADLQQALEREQSTHAATIEQREQEWTREREALSARGGEAQQTLDRERGEFDGKLHKIVSGMAADHENDLGNAIEQREAARAEARQSSVELARLQRMLEHERTEFNEKLQKIVTGMAADHENDIGKAMEEREEARAEVRRLSMLLGNVQKQFEDVRAGTVDEKALRERIDFEWSEKLNTIVAHIASDHDADIGRAVEQKEEARAEVRTLTMRVNALQQQLERDRQMLLTAEEKWNKLRESLTARATAAEREVQRLKTAPLGVAPAPSPAASAEQQVTAEDGGPPQSAQAEPFGVSASIPTPAPVPSPFADAADDDHRRARADVLEIAEQAQAALKRTAPGTMPVPVQRDTRRSLILFVHHDPNVRTMWRDQLHKHGYDVLTAADGLEGLRVANTQKPDVVIADAQMPKMDGRELCQLIKSSEQTSSSKVVLMSGD
ncbi:MAG TPA: response regulator, partial [Thermoanaerobaculia bacterium]|nr:response regulator [Thermoanaerobaculia bacterium]